MRPARAKLRRRARQKPACPRTTNGDPQLEGTSGQPGHSSSVQAIVDVDGTLAFIHPESGEGNYTASFLDKVEQTGSLRYSKQPGGRPSYRCFA